MRDRAFVNCVAGAFRIDVPPIAVAGDVRETVDQLLIDQDPVGCAKCGADGGFQFDWSIDDALGGGSHAWSHCAALSAVPRNTRSTSSTLRILPETVSGNSSTKTTEVGFL